MLISSEGNIRIIDNNLNVLIEANNDTYESISVAKDKKNTYIGGLIIVGLFQLYMIKSMMYGKYIGLMPDYLSLWVGLEITLILYLVSSIFSYLIYKCDLETIPLIPFMVILLIETFLVLSVFVPYII